MMESPIRPCAVGVGRCHESSASLVNIAVRTGATPSRTSSQCASCIARAYFRTPDPRIPAFPNLFALCPMLFVVLLVALGYPSLGHDRFCVLSHLSNLDCITLNSRCPRSSMLSSVSVVCHHACIIVQRPSALKEHLFLPSFVPSPRTPST